MKSTPTKSVPALGMDERLKTQQGSASLIRNCRIADNGMGWTNDRGWEPLIPDIANTTYYPIELKSVIDGFVWSRHQGAENYFFQENETTSGETQLFYLYGNRGASAQKTKIQIGVNRSLPKANDVGTQYAPYGRFCLIVNGKDPMWKFWGRNRYSPFGFTLPTPSPQVLYVDTAYPAGAATPANAPEPAGNSISTIFTDTTTALGLGTATDDTTSTFSWRISFITDTGSESPLSSPQTTSWSIDDSGGANTTIGKYGVLLSDIPTGPKGTVARRIYRTKNMKNGTDGAGETYYYATQINDNTTNEWLDVIPDNLLGSEKDVTDSVIISGNYSHAVAWNGVMWLAGGESHPTRVIYSSQGLPEQFGMSNYFEVGVRNGGHITGLVPYYDSLLVFREKAIDIIRFQNNSYTIGTFSSDIGTTATRTISSVAGKGVMFLSYDGVYSLTGGTAGGSEIKITNMSQGIEKELRRINKMAMARATASYSSREKEYWVHYPSDGNVRPTRGACYHTDVQAWSLRNNDSKAEEGTDDGGYEFNWIGTHPMGWFLLGCEAHIYNAGAYNGAPRVQGNIGIQVWSAANKEGNKVVATVNQDNTFAYSSDTSIAKSKSIYASAWNDLGNPSIKKRYLSVEIEGVSQGYNTLTLEYATNWKEAYTTGASIYNVEPETESTDNADYIFGPVTNAGIEKPEATFDVGKWEDDRLINLRWDVKTGLVTNFKWRIKESNLFLLSSSKLDIVSSNRNTITSGAGTNNV